MRYLDRPRKARIQIIPMIDIMLFLLVFFVIITLHMIPDTGIGAQLPSSSTAKSLPTPKVVVGIKQNGSIQVKDHKVSLKALRHRLKQDGPKTHLTIASAKGAPVKYLVRVMDAARKAGVTNIGMATNRSQPQS